LVELSVAAGAAAAAAGAVSLGSALTRGDSDRRLVSLLLVSLRDDRSLLRPRRRRDERPSSSLSLLLLLELDDDEPLLLLSLSDEPDDELSESLSLLLSESLSLSLLELESDSDAGSAVCAAMITLGAFLRWSRRPSLQTRKIRRGTERERTKQQK
jgi:hypothetical protein